MTRRRQAVRRALQAHAREQLADVMNARLGRRELTGATLRRLADDGTDTGEVLHLDAGQARELLGEQL